MAVTKEILSLAVETGDALLRNGAEVYRVEDTVMHILEAYEIEEYDVYVLSNGIFASANENKDDACSMIRHIPLGQTHLGRIAALNQLSREICSHECSLKDAWTRLDECKAIPTQRKTSKFITNIFGSAFVTLVSLITFSVGLPVLYDKIIIGAIMPLVPGIALTTSIRDFFNGDYLSGAIHMIDAVLTAFCIAAGVGTVMTIYNLAIGGIL